MSRVRQSVFCLAAIVASFAAQAQTPGIVPVKFSATPTNLMPPVPTMQSPVNFFRQLLLMPPAERNKSLASRTPESRARIQAKVREYLALEPDERELRLRATELRWYLTPLLRAQPEDRESGLAQVPPELRELVRSRLAQWDLLSRSLQQEFLANDKTLNYVAHVETQAPSSTDPQQQKIAEQVSNFFILTPAEEQQLLGTLSETEQAQMEKTLKTFGQLPAQQRSLCIRNYAKFAGMTSTERAEFLKNSESWSKMSPEERRTWRDLVANIPLWPPIPTAMPPLPPQPTPRAPKASMATN
jgi:hypothetical protein